MVRHDNVQRSFRDHVQGSFSQIMCRDHAVCHGDRDLLPSLGSTLLVAVVNLDSMHVHQSACCQSAQHWEGTEVISDPGGH